jgi:hypothetical protein
MFYDKMKFHLFEKIAKWMKVHLPVGKKIAKWMKVPKYATLEVLHL